MPKYIRVFCHAAVALLLIIQLHEFAPHSYAANPRCAANAEFLREKCVSDFFISQILVLLPLLIFLVRPFCKTLRYINGLPIFPLLALAVECTAVCAFGFRVEMLPVAFCSVVIFAASIPRLVSFFSGLPTDEVRIGSLVFCSMGIIMLGICGYVTFLVQPLPAPDVAAAADIQKHTVLLYRGRNGTLTAKNDISEILNKTEASCTVWAPITEPVFRAPVTETEQRRPCPIVFYVPGAQADSHSRETMARILAGNGYIVFSVDIPHRSYTNAKRGSLIRAADIASIRQLILLSYAHSIPEAYVQYNAAWLQEQLNITAEAAAVIFTQNNTKDTSIITQQLPPFTTKEPYLIFEHFLQDKIPDISAAGIAAPAGIVQICGVGVPSVQNTPAMQVLNIADSNPMTNGIECNTLILYGTTETLVPFGEAYINHPAFAFFCGLTSDAHPELFEQTVSYKIKAYFDKRAERPVPVMQRNED